MTSRAGRDVRILYAIGPGDVVSSFGEWRAGRDTVSETSVTFSSQFFDFCRTYGVRAHAISSYPRRGVVRDGGLLVENRPKPLQSARGMAYHVNEIAYGLALVAKAARERPDALVVDSGTTHWFVLALAGAMGIPVVACLHNSVRPGGKRPTGGARVAVDFLNGLFFRWHAAAVLCCSPQLESQVLAMAGKTAGPVLQFRAMYRRGFLDAPTRSPPVPPEPLRILYVGRLEVGKGVLDLIEIAAELERTDPGRCEWEVVGWGAASDALAAAVDARGLHNVRLTGRLERAGVREAYARSDVVIIPTRSDLGEGMPMVAAEAVLVGRPVLTSRVSNTLDVLGAAVIEALPDDLHSYADAIRRLIHEPERYEVHASACHVVREQFLDPRHGLGEALARALAHVGALPRVRGPSARVVEDAGAAAQAPSTFR